LEKYFNVSATWKKTRSKNGNKKLMEKKIGPERKTRK